MKTDLETLLIRSMRDEVKELPGTPTDVLARARAGHRRHTITRLATSAVGVTAVAAGLAVALVVPGSDGGMPVPGPGTAAPLPSTAGTAADRPKLRLLAAFTATDTTTFRIHERLTGRYRDHPQFAINADFTGAVDPARRAITGQLTRSDPDNAYDWEFRQLPDRWYSRVRMPGEAWDGWISTKPQGDNVIHFAMPGIEPLAFSTWTGATAGAGSLVELLRERGTVELVDSSGTGSAALDTYRFGYDRPADASFAAMRVTGTVVVHRDSSLVARFTLDASSVGKIEQATITWHLEVTLDGYGQPVTVQIPQPAETVSVPTGPSTTAPAP